MIVILCSVLSLVVPDTGRGVLSVSRYVLSSGVLLFLTPVVVFSALSRYVLSLMIAFTLSLRCRWNPSIASRMCGWAMHLLSEFGHDQCREWQIEMAFCLHYIIDIHNLRQNTAKINYIGEKQHVVASLTWYTSLFRCVVTSQTWLVHFPLHMVRNITELFGIFVPIFGCSGVW